MVSNYFLRISFYKSLLQQTIYYNSFHEIGILHQMIHLVTINENKYGLYRLKISLKNFI